MMPHECLEGVVVRHSITGAIGLIIRGGYRPRVRWYPNGRVIRVEENELRYVAADEVAFRRAKAA